MKKTILSIIIFLVCSLSCYSQSTLQASLKETNFFPGSLPSTITKINNYLYFGIGDKNSKKVYKYNTESQIVSPVFGSEEYEQLQFRGNSFYKVNNKVYFLATDSYNLQLWANDLSSNISTKIFDFGSESNNYDIEVLNNKLFVSYFNNLYIFDGIDNTNYSLPNLISVSNEICNFNGAIYFLGSSNSNIKELWKTDGTVGGTTIVKQIHSGHLESQNHSLEKIFSLNDQIIFSKSMGGKLKLWSSDGTDVGTNSYYDITLPVMSIEFFDVKSENQSEILFKWGNNLWRTNGTNIGTQWINTFSNQVSDIFHFQNIFYINTTGGVYINENTANSTLFDNTLETVGVSEDGSFIIFKELNDDDSFLYFYDGFEIYPTNIKYGYDNHFVEKDNKIYYSGSNEEYFDFAALEKNTELFYFNKLDKTFGKEKEIVSFYSGLPQFFTKVGNSVYFIARDGIYYQVYKKTETDEVIKLTYDLEIEYPTNYLNYYPVTKSGNYLYITNKNLLRVNTINDEIEKIFLPENELFHDIYPVSDNEILVKTFNSSNNRTKIWKLVNGESQFELLVEKTSNPNLQSYSYSKDYIKTNTGLYFSIINGENIEIWKSNGSQQNTVKLADIPGYYWRKHFLGLLDNKIFITSHPNIYSNNYNLYYIDDNNGQLYLVKTLNNNIYNESFVKDDKLYFFTRNQGNISELYQTDGISQNTQLVTEFESEQVTDLVECDGIYYFTDVHRGKLSRTDGTESGTFMIGNPAQEYSCLVCYNDQLHGIIIDEFSSIFRVDPNTNNIEIFEIIVNDEVLDPMYDYPFFNKLFTDDEKLYFSMNYKNHGNELFITNINNNPVDREDFAELPEINKVLIYPNPANEKFNVELSGNENILSTTIFDLNGKLISRHFENQIKISHLSSGIYLLLIEGEFHKYQSKVVKK